MRDGSQTVLLPSVPRYRTVSDLMTIDIRLGRRWSAGDGAASDSVCSSGDGNRGPFDNV